MKERCEPFLETGWELVPEGAVIRPSLRTAVIADLHLGYEWARGAAGDCVPAHSLRETISRLTRVLERATIDRLIVAGDLVESARCCSRTESDVEGLRAWLGKNGVELIVIEGNHDRRSGSRTPTLIRSLPLTIDVAGWTVGHGDRPINAPRTISGHHHPVLRFGGITAPCFVIGSHRIILPAFSNNAAGGDILTVRVPRDWDLKALRCVATTGQELLDFGTIDEMKNRLRPRASRPAGRTRFPR